MDLWRLSLAELVLDEGILILQLALIAAAARNNVIGRDNQLPWHLPQDLKHFKAVTLGKPVIMGRKTFESIGKPLPGRTNIVVSRNAGAALPEGVRHARSLDDALQLARKALEAQGAPAGEVMIMGGGEIYRNSLPMADRVYLTRVDLEPEGDTYFPSLLESEWRLASESEGDPKAPLAYWFQVYERTAGKSEMVSESN